MYDAIVVGAGPAGSRVAAAVAGAGRQVLLLEEHAAVGRPVHCTGIVGADCVDRYQVPNELVLSRIDRFHIIAPDGTECHLPGTSPIVVLDRGGLDRMLADRAISAGAELHTQARVQGLTQASDHVRVQVRYPDGLRMLSSSMVVLACGAMSNLPAATGLSQPAAWYRSVQSEWQASEVRGAEVYLGSRFSQGAFAWTVPIGPGAVKAGLMTPQHARRGYQHLLDIANPRLGLREPLARPLWRRMPMGLVSRSVLGRVAAVGDAAGQIKTTTGGGIYYALLCADLLADAMLRGRLQRYEGAWQTAIGRDLQSGCFARRALERLDDAELCRLVLLCQRDEVQRVLARHWHFDFHQGVLMALATTPSLRRLAAETCLSRGFQRLLRMTGRLCLQRPIESI